MVKNISMNIDEVLELDYLVEGITDDVVNVSSEPTSGASSIDYIATQTSVFNPSETGTYKLNINGQTVEIDVVDIPDSEVGKIDDFEDGDISEYQQDTDQFNIESSIVNQGSYALSGTNGGGTGTPVEQYDAFIWSENLDNVPSRGWEFAYDFRFSSSSNAHGVIFCVQDPQNYYYARANNENSNHIYKVKDGSIAKSDTANVSNYDPDNWYSGTVQIGSPTISFTDSANNTTVSIDDSEWDTGWFGWVASEDFGDGGNQTYSDNAEVTQLL